MGSGSSTHSSDSIHYRELYKGIPPKEETIVRGERNVGEEKVVIGKVNVPTVRKEEQENKEKCIVKNRLTLL